MVPRGRISAPGAAKNGVSRKRNDGTVNCFVYIELDTRSEAVCFVGMHMKRTNIRQPKTEYAAIRGLEKCEHAS